MSGMLIQSTDSRILTLVDVLKEDGVMKMKLLCPVAGHHQQ